jgi:hypothetical protein
MTDKNTLVLQSCTAALSVECGLCSETSVPSSGDSNEIITLKIVGEVVRIKEEDDPIAISFSSIKDEPEVSLQTFQHCLGLPSVIVPFCMPFHINNFPVVNGNFLYIFTEYDKYKC